MYVRNPFEFDLNDEDIERATRGQSDNDERFAHIAGLLLQE